MKVWTVLLEYYDDEGQLVDIEVVIYDNEQTARQHADRDNGRVRRADVRSKMREY